MPPNSGIMASVCAIVIACSLLVVTAPSSSQAFEFPGSSYDGSLVIGAFNIQVFGLSKVGKPDVVETLVKILRRYDLVLIQEIRDSSQTAVPTLLKLVNANLEDKYDVIVSERLGRTSSKEQYAFLYKPSRLTVLWSYVYEDDTHDRFEREPFVVYFESPTTAVDRFAMIGIHIKPSEAVEEINHLVHVYEDFVARSGNKNAIIAGDFNADCGYVSKTSLYKSALRTDQRFSWIISDDQDTTVAKSDCAYDRFVIAGDELSDNIHPDRTGTFYFDKHYGLDIETTEDVSDHYPIEMVIQGNLQPIQPMSTTTPDSISCSGSFRTVVWMCQLVVGQEDDMPVCIHKVVQSLVGYIDRCTDDWIRLFMNYPKI
ncbi:deoxyribonuclease-1-like [Patiria miniata]|uniref:Endonuclease/exonuclease/phosphatase domain-containing protein n=1 Tax=Patiria miniata TaxID=46514 RepID=A0A914BRJ4_PATMI|nr:deoxyribonuclease-1-like [Patiria miniata]XP_038078127.1 deoxyribonuclease-1-like [Patiria miniata]XP_038078128.1 deoxyribonuclease-1-like [Patiria miniata]